MIVSIYGRALGPATACTGPDVAELCGTIVTVNGIRASLLYVHDRQIKCPSAVRCHDRRTRSGRRVARGRVCFGSSSYPAGVSAHLADRACLRRNADPDGRAAYWASLAFGRYPIRISPVDLGGHVFEVRRNGIHLKRPPQAVAPSVAGGLGSPGSIGGGGFLGLPTEPKVKGRLPLHLAFRFDGPLKYEVRYIGYD